jgi:hypothetical protein
VTVSTSNPLGLILPSTTPRVSGVISAKSTVSMTITVVSQAPGKFAARVYASNSPFAYADLSNNSALLMYLGALGTMFQEIEDLASDNSDGPGTPGWSVLLDPANIPSKGLPWLGQLVGVQVNPALTVPQQRSQVKSVNAQARGSFAAFQAAPIPYLTGLQRVLVRERDPAASPTSPAYGISVFTYTSETPNSALVLAALTAVKPAGDILVYTVVAGQSWATLNANYATWNAVKAHYTSWDGVKSDQTGF